jgi:hypothetical protein
VKDLIGKGKPFYSALDKAAGLLKRKVGTGAEFMKELMALPGIKQSEIEERKLGELLGMPRMTHDQFMANLATRPAPAIREKVFGEEPSQGEVIKESNKLIRQMARNYSNMADTSSEAREMMNDELRRVRENQRPQIMESVKRGLGSATHHEAYTLPGGENYREILIKAPKQNRYWAQKHDGEKVFFDDPDEASRHAGSTGQAGRVEGSESGFSGVGAHFGGQSDILASMRVKDRTGPNGEKLLHLEELQSDWHQQGREKGYRGDYEPVWQMLDKRDELHDKRQELIRQMRAIDKTGGTPPQELIDQIHGIRDQLQEIEDKKDKARNAVPDAPFKKNWEEMALKRLIHHAAENGYHGIVVTPGAEQADRYSLAKHLDALHYNPDTHRLIGKKNGRMLIDEVAVPPEKLESYVGKDTAKKVMEQEPNVNGLRSLLGEELVVGGEGMKGFYDKKVPNILNAIGKKHGIKTQLHGHSVHTPKSGQSITDMLRAENMTENDWQDMNPDDRMAMIDRHDQRSKEHHTKLHHFPITEDMRKDILTNGLPLYADGGEVDAEEVFMGKGGKVKELEQYLRDREGEYGLKRLQRAADEIPGLENMYTLDALKRAFGGDNAKALMTMDPALFEKYAVRLFDPNDYDEDEYADESPHGNIHEYIQQLAKIKGGFADVPFLEVGRRKPEYLPSIEGHEGRHRSRALTSKGVKKSLVQLLPTGRMREPMPRKYREDFIEAMKKELGEKRLVTPEGRSLLPADLTAQEHRNLENRNLVASNRPQLPEIYKDGGEVDAESYFFPNKE